MTYEFHIGIFIFSLQSFSKSVLGIQNSLFGTFL
jgi:hypothetical protein